MTGRHLLLYDGVCALCNGFVRFVLKHDRTGLFRFAPLQGETAGRFLRKWGKTPELLDTVYVVRDTDTQAEAVSEHAQAVLLVLEEIGGLWKALSRLLGVLPSKVLDVFYDLVARRRYRWFGRYDACPLPPPENRDRFLP